MSAPAAPPSRTLIKQMRDGARRIARERIGTYRGMFLARLARWPLKVAVDSLAGKIPRQPDLIAFGAIYNRLADNSAYLFFALHDDPELRCVWITGSSELARELRRAGYDARYRWSLSGLRAATTASWYVYSFAPSDVNRWLYNGATMLNLWHGAGLKGVQRDRDAPFDRIYSAKEGGITARVFAEDRSSPDWFVTTSPTMSGHFGRAFALPPERCLEFGYPRNMHLIEGRQPPAPMVDQTIYQRLSQASFVVGYFPTWRYDSRAATPEGAPDLREIAETLERQNAVLAFKSHYASDGPGVEHPSICVLPSDADLNAYLGLCQLLITDYSSVCTDFLLLGRPIIVFVPDLEHHLATHTFVGDPVTLTPGIVARTTDELYTLLRDVRSVPPAQNFPAALEYFWGHSEKDPVRQLAALIKSSDPCTVIDADREPVSLP